MRERTVDEFVEAIANAVSMPESSNDTIFVGGTVKCAHLYAASEVLWSDA